MDEPTEPTDDVRAKGRALIERLNDDESFRETFEADPEQTMADAGIPRELMGDLVTAIGSTEDAEVEGFVVRTRLGVQQTGMPCERTLECVPTKVVPIANTGACLLGSWYR